MRKSAWLGLTVVGVAGLFWVVQAGNLDPPGPPAPTMKTLVEVEPRILISNETTPGDSDSVFKISQPGSYYLGGNVAGVAGKHGIEIAADDVTLDINGFALIGVAGSLNGVVAAEFPTTRTDLMIRNGTVAAWGGHGIHVEIGFNVQIEDVRAARNTGNGILLESGSGNTVTHCAASSNGLSGIDAGINSTVSLCTVVLNGQNGIVASNGGSVTDCTANQNSGDGIQVGTRCRVVGNHCVQNGLNAAVGAGIHVLGSGSRIESNNVSHNDRGIDVDGPDNIVVKNTAASNVFSGIPSNYTFPLGVLNAVGEIVDVTNMITIDESESAWANFEF